MLLWYAVLARVRCRGLFYVSLPCPGVHPHGSRVVAHLQPLCWGFFSSFEVTWSGVRPVLNVSFVFCGFTLWLRWSSCADTRAGCLRKTRESYLGYAVHALKDSLFFLKRNGEIWIPAGLVVPWRSGSFGTAFVDAGAACLAAVNGQKRLLVFTVGLVALSGPGQGTAFADTGAGCPAVVSGSRSFCRHGSRLPCSSLGLRSFCRHGGWLPCSSLGLQGLL